MGIVAARRAPRRASPCHIALHGARRSVERRVAARRATRRTTRRRGGVSESAGADPSMQMADSCDKRPVLRYAVAPLSEPAVLTGPSEGGRARSVHIRICEVPTGV